MVHLCHVPLEKEIVDLNNMFLSIQVKVIVNYSLLAQLWLFSIALYEQIGEISNFINAS